LQREHSFTYPLLNDTSLEEWQEPVDLQESEMNDTVINWHQVLLHNLADALESISAAG
jgi:hypothetical protein